MCKDNNFFHNYYREFFFITRHRPKYNGFIYFMTQFQQITTRHCQIRKLITSLGTHSASNSHFQTQKKQLHLCNCLISRAENETRTRDPNLGKVVLYQLSYFRKYFCGVLFSTLSGKRDSNSRPQPWQGCALPTELFPHIF